MHEYHTPSILADAIADCPLLPSLVGTTGVVRALEPSAGIGRLVHAFSGKRCSADAGSRPQGTFNLIVSNPPYGERGGPRTRARVRARPPVSPRIRRTTHEHFRLLRGPGPGLARLPPANDRPRLLRRLRRPQPQPARGHPRPTGRPARRIPRPSNAAKPPPRRPTWAQPCEPPATTRRPPGTTRCAAASPSR
jgi:hypothetical protein